MNVFKFKRPNFLFIIRTNKTKPLAQTYQWDFKIKKISMPRIVLLNNMSLNPEYTYDNYYKRHLQAAPAETESDGTADTEQMVDSLAGEPKRTESLNVDQSRTNSEILEKWEKSGPKARFGDMKI